MNNKEIIKFVEYVNDNFTKLSGTQILYASKYHSFRLPTTLEKILEGWQENMKIKPESEGIVEGLNEGINKESKPTFLGYKIGSDLDQEAAERRRSYMEGGGGPNGGG